MRIAILEFLLKLFMLKTRKYLVLTKESSGMNHTSRQIAAIVFYDDDDETRQLAKEKLEKYIKQHYPIARKEREGKYYLTSVDELEIKEIQFTVKLVPDYLILDYN